MVEYRDEYHVVYGYKLDATFEKVFKYRDEAFAEALDIMDFGGHGSITHVCGWLVDGEPTKDGFGFGLSNYTITYFG